MKNDSAPFLLAAPLAGYNEPAFRILLSNYPYDLIYSEMVATKGVTYKNKNTLSMLKNYQEDKLGIQLFGNDWHDFLNTAQIIVERDLTKYIDINIGCCVKKIVRSGYGIALLENPLAVREIVRALNKEFPQLKITIKTRLGWKEGDGLLKGLLQTIKNEKLEWIVIHGRFGNQFFTGKANWEKIEEVTSFSPFPVIGNGDIFTLEDYYRARERASDVVGFALGRGILKNPLLALEIKEEREIKFEEKRDFYVSLLKLRKEMFGEEYALKETRKFYGWFLKGVKNASFYRNYFISEGKYDKILTTLKGIEN